jgi:hypothetical protein
MTSNPQIQKGIKEFALYLGLPLGWLALVILPIPVAAMVLCLFIYLSVLKAIKRGSAKRDAASLKPTTLYRQLIRPVVEIIITIPLALAATVVALGLAIISYFVWPFVLLTAIFYFIATLFKK